MCSMFCDNSSMFQRGGEPRPRIQNSAVSMIDYRVRSSGASFEVYRSQPTTEHCFCADKNQGPTCV